MVGYGEVILFRQPFFGLLEKLYFIIYEIRIINDPCAICTYQVVVMGASVRSFGQFISCPAITKVEFEDQPQLNKDLESPVYSSKAYGRMHSVHLHIYILGA